MATANQIVDVAQEYLQKVGFHAFSYRDIADRIGIRAASIHYHFPTKEHLACAIVERVRGDAGAALVEIERAVAAPTERLRRFCALFLQTWGGGDRLCPMCMLAMGQDAIPAAAREGVMQFWSDAESWVAGVVERGQRSGEFSQSLAPPAVARTFVAALEGAMVAARVFRDRQRLTDVIDFLMQSVANQPAGRRLS
jgi:TetR/AcrR family transcriptional regulator, transcriptional repressor for nem operon